jgi:DNA polymerase I-like protein with 3'-5' exonuclease and polymerase domains
MIAIVLDLETTVQKVGDDKDNSPYNPDNKCVSAHWLEIDPLGIPGAVSTLVFHHNEKPTPDPREALQAALDAADVLVAHNAKFDVSWLREMGFRLPASVWCTMIGEYIFARGQRAELSLEKTALRRRVTAKKSELIHDLFKGGTGFEAMPLDIVIEYAEADVQSCAEVYLKQLDDLEGEKNKGLKPVFDLMFDMLDFLVEIESNGVQIDLETLSDVEMEFRAEKDKIEKRLNEIVRDVMGDTPINLNSGIDMTRVVYSRRVNDRELHQKMFNIGLNAVGKPLPPPRMKPTEFTAAVRATTEIVYRTVLHCCPVCKGSGKQCKFTKAGQLYKVQPRCMECGGGGALYLSDGKIAGLRLVPAGPADASINGFKVDKLTIKALIVQAEIKNRPVAVEFLTKISRLNAVNTYLDSFVKGIQTWTRHDSVLHPNFNQTVAATARLSSTKPNFQNQPKGGKFPVRKCVVSRFEDGQILEADFSGLEFRVAGELSRDPQIIDDIKNGKDVHKQTASIIRQKPVSEVTKDERQGAKAYTFAPLYGGMGANEAPHVQKYFQEFFQIYKGLAVYHKTLMDGVLHDGIVRIPSGREYIWPSAKRLRNGRITNATQVVNYPVQGFATGDIVPLACIRAVRAFRERQLRSKLILTVHDSIVADVYPGEVEAVAEALSWAMKGVKDEILTRFGYEFVLPLDIEIEAGKNWMEMSSVPLT